MGLGPKSMPPQTSSQMVVSTERGVRDDAVGVKGASACWQAQSMLLSRSRKGIYLCLDMIRKLGMSRKQSLG